MPRMEMSPFWRTREPPLNLVGVALASSAPCIVSKTSLATLSPKWTTLAATTVISAVAGSKNPARTATASPSNTGAKVALRNGARVARKSSQPVESRGRTLLPRSAESASK